MNEKKTSDKPPLGIMSRYIWIEKRIQCLHEAINRYMNAGWWPNPEWVEEMGELVRNLPDRGSSPLALMHNDERRSDMHDLRGQREGTDLTETNEQRCQDPQLRPLEPSDIEKIRSALGLLPRNKDDPQPDPDAIASCCSRRPHAPDLGVAEPATAASDVQEPVACVPSGPVSWQEIVSWVDPSIMRPWQDREGNWWVFLPHTGPLAEKRYFGPGHPAMIQAYRWAYQYLHGADSAPCKATP